MVVKKPEISIQIQILYFNGHRAEIRSRAGTLIMSHKGRPFRNTSEVKLCKVYINDLRIANATVAEF